MASKKPQRKQIIAQQEIEDRQVYLSVHFFFFFCFKIFWRTYVLFVGPLVPLFWTCDVCPGFQSRDGSLACAHKEIPRLTSSAPPANLFCVLNHFDPRTFWSIGGTKTHVSVYSTLSDSLANYLSHYGLAQFFFSIFLYSEFVYLLKTFLCQTDQCVKTIRHHRTKCKYWWHSFVQCALYFCTSHGPFAHLGRTLLHWWVSDVTIAMCRN